INSVPPQPNCPTVGVPFRVSNVKHNEQCYTFGYTFPFGKVVDASCLRYAPHFTLQRQPTVKFHGVFASHWKSLASAPEGNVRRVLGSDSGDLVTPFMQADIQSAR